MCTAITYHAKDFYFGRNLDLEYSYDEAIIITPRNFPLLFRKTTDLNTHYAIIGIGITRNGFPLYYDAVNEEGLAMAGLSFPGNAVYYPPKEALINIASFEFIPYILGHCKNVKEAKELLLKINIAEMNFSEELPSSPLHWIIADKTEAITVEALKDGLRIHENPIGVLTNNPPFDMQMFNLNNYMSLSAQPPQNRLAKALFQYSHGMGAIGLPGDLSSMSRFVKAVFTKINSVSGGTETEAVSQFFHILYSVYQQRGCVRLDSKTYDFTVYSSCSNASKGIYYYTAYENFQITGVDMHKENLESNELISYPLRKKGEIAIINS